MTSTPVPQLWARTKPFDSHESGFGAGPARDAHLRERPPLHPRRDRASSVVWTPQRAAHLDPRYQRRIRSAPVPHMAFPARLLSPIDLVVVYAGGEAGKGSARVSTCGRASLAWAAAAGS